ncbi:MAG: flippase [Cyanophyceae cyanobacterium]
MTRISRLNNLLQFFTSKDKSKFKQRLFEKALGTFGLRVAATVLAFLTSILLARLLGVVEFGMYSYAVAWVRFLSIPATLGLDNLLVREVAVCQTHSNWGLARGLLSWTNRLALLLSGGIALSAIGLAAGLNLYTNPQMMWAFALAMLMLPIMTLRNLRLATMRGLHHIVIGLIPEHILAPLLIVILTGGAYLLLGEDLTAVWAVGMRLAAAVVTLIVGVRVLNRVLPVAAKQASPEYRGKDWIRSALPLAFLGSTYIINSQADILMLGAIKDTEAVGLYLPVTRGAQLINFVTIAANTVLAPTIASLYTTGNTEKLRRVIAKSTGTVFWVALLMAIGLFAFGHWYLLLFGVEFTRGHTALSILCFGQLVNAGTCAVSWLLIMTKYERFNVFSDSLGAILNIILNTLLIPRWSIEGAAVATTTSLVIVNIINAIFVQNKLHINATILGVFFRRKIERGKTADS